MRDRGLLVDLLLAVFCTAMLALMWLSLGEETIPYHFLFLALAIVYGFRVWPMGKTVIVMTVVTVATGLIFARSLAKDAIDLSEMAEVILMPLLVMAMVWHARRRETAMRAVRELSELNAALLAREHEFLRETSHAIRTPVTIARGYVDLAAMGTSEDETAEHLEVISRQLTRTETLSNRLLTLAALDSTGIEHVDMLDASAVARRAVRSWSVTADRIWVEDIVPSAWVLGDETALDAAIDALIENARHFTSRRDVIRVICVVDEASVIIGVADSGPGIDAEDLEHVFDRFWHRTPPDGVVGSGLGLAMVEAIALGHGGGATASRAPEGGALVTLALPRQSYVPSHDDMPNDRSSGQPIAHSRMSRGKPHSPSTSSDRLDDELDVDRLA
jgi:signal transduction histidine kinase